jgi:hypothetical protein
MRIHGTITFGLALKTNSLTLLISFAVNDFVENQIRKTPNERKMMNCNMVLILLMNINCLLKVKLTKCLIGENVNICQLFGPKGSKMAIGRQIR